VYFENQSAIIFKYISDDGTTLIYFWIGTFRAPSCGKRTRRWRRKRRRKRRGKKLVLKKFY